MQRSIRWDQETAWLQAGLVGSGAFLNVRTPDDGFNLMTIGWGQVGIVWSRPTFTVFVRPNRYTFGFMQTASDFTVSVPRVGELADALTLCGTKSGRDVNKVTESNLHLVDAQSVHTPVIAECGLHYECRILARLPLDQENMVSEDVLQKYETKNPHQIVLGEIVAAYVFSPPS